MKFLYTFFVLVFFVFVSCNDSVLPKPKGLLRLEYPLQNYKRIDLDCDFSFDKNLQAVLKRSYEKDICGYVIDYPKLNASIYLTYRKVNGDLIKLLKDAQNLTQEHVVKADEIIPRSYENTKSNIYGMFYEVLGDAASQSQFYVTDSTKHFLLGSLYFKVKPNYDSIYPAAKYLQKDMQILMESIKWKN